MSATVSPTITGHRSARTHEISVVASRWHALSARRKLQLAIAVVWLADAALQFQPYMFGRSFVTDTIEPTADGAPWIVAHPTLWAAHFMIHHITIYNSIFASIQLLIAAAIFYRPTVKIGLGASIVWGLGVWWLAEGIGGIFNNASPLMGAPGAVLLYVLIALLVWPKQTTPGAGDQASTADRSVLGSLVPKLAWATLWGGFALLALETTNRAPSAIHDMISGMQDGEPSWIKAIDRGLATPFDHHGTEASIILAILFAVTAAAVFNPRTVRVAVGLAVVLGAFIWVVQDFGTIATGSATDVNAGLPLIILAGCYWPLRSSAGSTASPAAASPRQP